MHQTELAGRGEVLTDLISGRWGEDSPLLGSLVGVLVSLPDSAVKERLAVTPIEELLHDAIYEVLNNSIRRGCHRRQGDLH
jgi:hypothetical protein